MSESLASLESHPVEVFIDPRPKKKQPTDFHLRLEDSSDNTPTIGKFVMLCDLLHSSTCHSKLEMMNSYLFCTLKMHKPVTH